MLWTEVAQKDRTIAQQQGYLERERGEVTDQKHTIAQKDLFIAALQDGLDKARQGLETAIQRQQLAAATAAMRAAPIGGGAGGGDMSAARILRLEQEWGQAQQAVTSQKETIRQVSTSSPPVVPCWCLENLHLHSCNVSLRSTSNLLVAGDGQA